MNILRSKTQSSLLGNGFAGVRISRRVQNRIRSLNEYSGKIYYTNKSEQLIKPSAIVEYTAGASVERDGTTLQLAQRKRRKIG